MERSSNPALRESIFSDIAHFDQYSAMTIEGTINKTVILLALVLVAAMFVWDQYATLAFLILPALILGLIIALITIFRQEYSPYTAPVYALVEGVIIGLLSGYMDQIYPGIVIQAVCLTFGVFFLLLFIFRMRLIQATEKFRLVVIAATGSIALLYIADLVLGVFGQPVGLVHVLEHVNEGAGMGKGVRRGRQRTRPLLRFHFLFRLRSQGHVIHHRHDMAGCVERMGNVVQQGSLALLNARGHLLEHLLLGRDHPFDLLAIVIAAFCMHDREGENLP